MPVKFSEQFKSQAVQKAITHEGSLTLEQVAKDLNIGYSTLQRWVRNYKRIGEQPMTKDRQRRPQDWLANERLAALMAIGTMDASARSAYCRAQGIYPEHLEQWQRDFSQMPTGKKTKISRETKTLKQEVKILKKEISRKDKALAEATAILVLKKKLAALYGEDED